MTRSATVGDGHGQRDNPEFAFWREHTHINVSPRGGTIGSRPVWLRRVDLAGWYGNDTITPLVPAPFVFAFGGIARLLAGPWSYRARGALATGIHGAWGSLWIAYGLYHLLAAVDAVPGTATSSVAATASGFWFVGLAAITWVGAVVTTAENLAIALVLLTLAGGATLLAIGLIGGLPVLETIACYVLIVSAVLGWYAGSAMVLAAKYKRVVLPHGQARPRAEQARNAAEGRYSVLPRRAWQQARPVNRAGQHIGLAAAIRERRPHA